MANGTLTLVCGLTPTNAPVLTALVKALNSARPDTSSSKSVSPLVKSNPLVL